MEGEGEAGGVEAEASEQERGICAPQFIGRPLGEVRERVRMKSGGVYIPSSIDVRPMGKKGTNAYAQMGLQSLNANGAQLGPGESCLFTLMIQLTP